MEPTPVFFLGAFVIFSCLNPCQCFNDWQIVLKVLAHLASYRTILWQNKIIFFYSNIWVIAIISIITNMYLECCMSRYPHSHLDQYLNCNLPLIFSISSVHVRLYLYIVYVRYNTVINDVASLGDWYEHEIWLKCRSIISVIFVTNPVKCT